MKELIKHQLRFAFEHTVNYLHAFIVVVKTLFSSLVHPDAIDHSRQIEVAALEFYAISLVPFDKSAFNLKRRVLKPDQSGLLTVIFEQDNDVGVV